MFAWTVFCFFFSLDESQNHRQCRCKDLQASVGGLSSDVNTRRSTGMAHLVGLLLGHHGAGHVLCHLWECHGFLCLLCSYQTGKSSFCKCLEYCRGGELTLTITMFGLWWKYNSVSSLAIQQGLVWSLMGLNTNIRLHKSSQILLNMNCRPAAEHNYYLQDFISYRIKSNERSLLF